MASARLRRVVANLASDNLRACATLVLGMATTPVLLRLLGEERFGAARVTLDWIGYLSLFDLGLAEAARPFLSAAVGEGDHGRITRALATVMRKVAQAAALKLAVGLLFCLAVTSLVPVRPALAGDLRQAAFVAMLLIAATPLACFWTLADVEQRGYLVHLLLLFQAVLTNGLAIVFARCSGSIAGYSAALVLGGLPFYLVLGVSGLRRFPGTVRLAFSKTAVRGAPAAFGRLRRAAFVKNLCDRVSVLTDNIFIATLSAPQLVTPFFITQRLALVANGQLQGIGGATWAGLWDLRLREGEAAFRARVIELTRILVLLGIGILAPIAAYNRSFVACWVGMGAYGGDALTALTAVNALLVATTSVWSRCFEGLEKYDRLVPVSVVGAVLNLVASVVFTRLLGLVGPALGTTAMFLVTLPWWVVLMRDAIGIPLGKLGAALYRPLAVGSGHAVVLWIVARAYPPHGWTALFLSVSASMLLYAVLCAAFILDKAERRAWSARALGLIGRVPAL
jgi:O-antigen/teichoic acid export membrane protein